MHPFRAAVEARDLSPVPALLAEDATFLSPVAFKPYTGRTVVAAILDGAFRVFEDFRYVRELEGDAAHALVFEARVGDRAIHGCDFLHHDAAGLINEFCVMVRPLSAANALAEAMGREFVRIEAELRG